MPKVFRIYGKYFIDTCKSKHKARRGAHHFKTAKYKNQWTTTESNRLRKQATHKLKHPNDKEASPTS